MAYHVGSEQTIGGQPRSAGLIPCGVSSGVVDQVREGARTLGLDSASEEVGGREFGFIEPMFGE